MPIDAPLNVIELSDADDPRLIPYTALKERQLAAEMGLFICEGEHNVRRLLASAYDVHSILIARHRLYALAEWTLSDLPVYVADNEFLSQVVGFQYHLGIVACGVRPDKNTVGALLPAQTLIVLPEVRHVENLGLVIRTAHALGVDGLLMSDMGCDPFTRRVIRVSMGSVFSLPVARSTNLHADLTMLRETHGFELVAAVSEPDATTLGQFVRPNGAVAVVFGNEPDGLSDAWSDLCDVRVTIPIKPGVDSLNLAVAAGIILHQITPTNAR